MMLYGERLEIRNTRSVGGIRIRNAADASHPPSKLEANSAVG